MTMPSQQKIESTSFIVFLVLISIALLGLLQYFVEPILWASIFALLFRAPNFALRRLLRGRKTLAAFLTLIIILLFVIIPTFLVGAAVVDEGTSILADIQQREFDPGKALVWVEQQLPTLREFAASVGVDFAELRAGFRDAAVTISQFIGGQLIRIGQNAVTTAVLLLVMLYLLFFLLRDGEVIVRSILNVLPLGDEREAFLIDKIAEVLRATVKGTFVVAIVQGTLGGIAFAVLGIQAAVLWGVVMALLAMLPIIGAFLIWLPAAIMFAVNGDWVRAVSLFLFGFIVISFIDNLLRPYLVGRDTKMPDYLVLLTTLGGLSLFGLSGFVLGPMVAAIFLASWALFAREFNNKSPPASSD
ncbi:MAG: AI-2E family transporter [Pseudomonadota bacterium]